MSNMAWHGWLIISVGLVAGCASTPAPSPMPPPAAVSAPKESTPLPPPKQPAQYRCDDGLEFDVRFGDGSAELVFASREPEMLLRDAGGTSPGHRVYSSTRLKAEFGLDPDGRGVKLNFVTPAVQVMCARNS